MSCVSRRSFVGSAGSSAQRLNAGASPLRRRKRSNTISFGPQTGFIARPKSVIRSSLRPPSTGPVKRSLGAWNFSFSALPTTTWAESGENE